MRRHFEDTGTQRNEKWASSYTCFLNKFLPNPGNAKIESHERSNSLPGKEAFQSLSTTTENKTD